MANSVVTDTRTGRISRHRLVAQFRQSVFGRLAGYEDVNDADRLGCDPAMGFIVGGHAVTAQATSTSQMGRFETEVMTRPDNIGSLVALSGMWIDRIAERRPMKAVMLDMNSSVSPTFGDQENTAYNDTSAAPVTIHCSSLTSSAIWNAALCVAATFTLPTAGMMFWNL